MKILFYVLLLSICTLPEILYSQFSQIENYQKYIAVGQYHGKDVAVIRKYTSQNNPFFIAIGFDDIKSYIIPASEISIQVKNWNEMLSLYKTTPYIRAIQAAGSQSMPLHDAGIQHVNTKGAGILLTVDLCPSLKSMDRIIFTSIIEEFRKFQEPQPIGLAITGKFLKYHSQDIDWIKELIKSGAVDIVWINHTFNHNYHPNLPLINNFLLEPSTHLDSEILLLEKSLLEKELMISAFFRFPGLVSDRKLVEQVSNYGLITLGSDAWLAKGQTVKNGDIVLIHGNGNEPVGVKNFLALLKKEKINIDKKQWLLYDLREDIGQEFKTENK